MALLPRHPERRLWPRRGYRPSRHLGCATAGRLLLNHLISAQQYRWGYGKAKRRGGLTVYDHLELGRKLHREIARLLAAKDAIDVIGGARDARA